MGNELAIIFGLKVLSDIATIIAMSMPKTEGMTDQQKSDLLKQQQAQSADLLAKLTAMAQG